MEREVRRAETPGDSLKEQGETRCHTDLPTVARVALEPGAQGDAEVSLMQCPAPSSFFWAGPICILRETTLPTAPVCSLSCESLGPNVPLPPAAVQTWPSSQEGPLVPKHSPAGTHTWAKLGPYRDLAAS